MRAATKWLPHSGSEESLFVKNPFRNARVITLTIVLLVGATILLLREQRASFLRPGLRLNAYVSTGDGGVAGLDLGGLAWGRGCLECASILRARKCGVSVRRADMRGC